GAAAAIAALVQLTPKRARRLDAAEREEEVAASALRPGDRCRVRPGENIPADGRVTAGGSSVNQASITGESLPVDKTAGDDVCAGTQNLTGVLEFTVTRAGADTTLGKVADLIAQAERSRLPVQRLADRYAGYYTPVALAAATLVWMFTRDLGRVSALLIVSCPCALILAAPTAMVAAVAAAARLGVLVKDVARLEVAAMVRTVVFDKTGTLTEGRLAVARLSPAAGVEPAELLAAAAAVECHSNHPVARAVCRLAAEAGVTWTPATAVRETAGQGLAAQDGAASLLIGRAAWLREQGVVLPAPDAKAAAELSLVFAARDGRYLGWIGLRDTIRPTAREALAALKAGGVAACHLLTGDRHAIGEQVAAAVGADHLRADCLPHDKAAYVEALKRPGQRIAVVGDGVNDAPCLMAGDLGVAMGGAGADVAVHSASVILMNHDLRLVPWLFQLARRTRAVMIWNLAIGLVFITGGLALAVTGAVTPILAALLHSGGTLLVVFNSARLFRTREIPRSPLTASAATLC
ncbi:MAG: cation-translocating P-type ATPase, partial [Lentisphaeria bacterium]